MQDPIVIVSAKRTPMGGLGGELSPATAPELGVEAAKAAIAASGANPEDIDEVVMGNVLGAGQGQAPARQVALGAGLPTHSTATTINKMCGSGMKATMLAHDLLIAGSANVVLAGGMESMSNAPYLLPRVREGLRMGHGNVKDHMFLDGLEDAYDRGTLMGVFGERFARKTQITRDAQDEFAIGSLDRALAAQSDGRLDQEISPIEINTRKGSTVVSSDEQPRIAKRDKIPTLKPAFATDGSVTAANSSSISDGAATLVLTRASVAEAKGLTPIARILGHAGFGGRPEDFPSAPVGAMENLLEKTRTRLADYDLFEVNEAFAVVPITVMSALGIPREQMNVHGGACALGHPIGASGARILVTLLNAMKVNDVPKGMASVCLAGGEATAIAVERMN